MDGGAGEVTYDLVRRRFEAFGNELAGEAVIEKFEVAAIDGVKIVLYRAGDLVMASVELLSTEVLTLDLGNTYHLLTTTYDDDYKWEIIEQYLYCVAQFLRRQYVEEVDERNGMVVRRSIHFVDGGLIIASSSIRAKVLRLFGYTRSVRQA